MQEDTAGQFYPRTRRGCYCQCRLSICYCVTSYCLLIDFTLITCPSLRLLSSPRISLLPFERSTNSKLLGGVEDPVSEVIVSGSSKATPRSLSKAFSFKCLSFCT